MPKGALGYHFNRATVYKIIIGDHVIMNFAFIFGHEVFND